MQGEKSEHTYRDAHEQKFDGKKNWTHQSNCIGRMKNRLQCVYIDELDFGRLRITFVDFDF